MNQAKLKRLIVLYLGSGFVGYVLTHGHPAMFLYYRLVYAALFCALLYAAYRVLGNAGEK